MVDALVELKLAPRSEQFYLGCSVRLKSRVVGLGQVWNKGDVGHITRLGPCWVLMRKGGFTINPSWANIEKV